MHRVILVCDGVPHDAGAQAASDITAEFAHHRRWQKNVACTWDGHRLRLQADTEHDPQGLGLIDEFSDCISAYIRGCFDGDITVQAITPLPSPG